MKPIIIAAIMVFFVCGMLPPPSASAAYNNLREDRNSQYAESSKWQDRNVFLAYLTYKKIDYIRNAAVWYGRFFASGLIENSHIGIIDDLGMIARRQADFVKQIQNLAYSVIKKAAFSNNGPGEGSGARLDGDIQLYSISKRLYQKKDSYGTIYRYSDEDYLGKGYGRLIEEIRSGVAYEYYASSGRIHNKSFTEKDRSGNTYYSFLDEDGYLDPVNGAVYGRVCRRTASEPDRVGAVAYEYEYFGKGEVPGDINEDGNVDIMDVSLFQTLYGLSNNGNGSAGFSKADLNRDGTVNAQDKQILEANYGIGMGTAKTTRSYKTVDRGVGTMPAFQDLITAESKFVTRDNTYYVDATLGDDNNSGLSADQAWKSLDKLNAFLKTGVKPGDVFLFKRGEVWIGSEFQGSVPEHNAALRINGVNGTAEKPIRFGAYGDAEQALPTIKGYVYDIRGSDADWTTSGGNVWKRYFYDKPHMEEGMRYMGMAAGQAGDIMVDGYTQYDQDRAHVDPKTGDWFGNSSDWFYHNWSTAGWQVVYVYYDNHGKSPSQMEKLEYADHAIKIDNSAYIKIEDLRVADSGIGLYIGQTGGVSDIVVNRVVGDNNYRNFHIVGETGRETKRVEINDSVSYGATVAHGFKVGANLSDVGNDPAIKPVISDVALRRCKSYGSEESGFRVSAVNLTIEDCVAEGNKFNGFTIGTSDNVVVTGTSAINNESSGFYIFQSPKSMDIKNSISKDNGRHGIYIDSIAYGGDIDISGNSLLDNGRAVGWGAAVSINSSKTGMGDISISDNILKTDRESVLLWHSGAVGENELIESNSYYKKNREGRWWVLNNNKDPAKDGYSLARWDEYRAAAGTDASSSTGEAASREALGSFGDTAAIKTVEEELQSQRSALAVAGISISRELVYNQSEPFEEKRR